MSLVSVDLMKLARHVKDEVEERERERRRVMEASREFVNGRKEEEKWRGEDKKAKRWLEKWTRKELW